MLVVDPRAARLGPQVPGHLDRPLLADVHDDDLLVAAGAVHPHPHRLAEQLVRHRVLAALEGDHRGVRRDLPGHPERDRVRLRRHRVQPGPFLGEHLRRNPAGDPVHPGVDLVMNASHAASSSANEA